MLIIAASFLLVAFFMLLKITIQLLALLISVCGLAQSELTIEAFGPGGHFSFNAQMPVAKRLGVRVGLGALNIDRYSCNRGVKINFPAGIHYKIGSRAHYLELGAGGVANIITSSTKMGCLEEENNFFMNHSFYGYILAGYKYDTGKKLTYRIFVSPLFRKEMKFWAGAGFGIKVGQ